MSTYTTIWTTATLIGVGVITITTFPYHLSHGSQKYLAPAAFLFVLLLSQFWQSQVTKIVPETYLDEVFHIPQAQAYCHAQYQTWDPKLTTPPGLYALTVLFLKLTRGVCDVGSLRLFNVLALLVTTVYALDIRTLLTSPSNVLKSRKSSAIHTAVNIALFPPLFFFSGLYYTDVLSTCCVLLAYKSFLERKGIHDNSGKGLYLNYAFGILALTLRQTNIFWVAVFLGGAEVVRTIKQNLIPPIEAKKVVDGEQTAMDVIRRWGRGDIHDVALEDAGLIDFALMPISLIIAILNQPLLVITRLWPYIALLLSFGAFVIINGGVVLGDKSNHIATIHLPQLLYLFPFITFFSIPLILPAALTHTLTTIRNIFSPPPTNTAAPLLPRELVYVLTFMTTITALMVTLAIIHFNTIIHPFTLADNRHYMFYIFRLTILRPVVRYALAPIYLGSCWAVYLSLCPTTPSPRPTTTTTPTPTPTSETTTSTILLLLLPTALSLITAPLVEPRYFIIPWVLYRLHLPSKQRTRWLSLETIWFLVINLGTGYLFLYRGFEWTQEPGKVQRFMW